MTHNCVPLITRAALIGVVITALPACSEGRPASQSQSGESTAATLSEEDEWGENEVPPTRDEILAAPAAHDADAIAAALAGVAEDTDTDTDTLALVLALLSDEREEVRWHAVQALRALGGPDAEAALLRVAVDDVSELVREEAAQ